MITACPPVLPGISAMLCHMDGRGTDGTRGGAGSAWTEPGDSWTHGQERPVRRGRRADPLFYGRWGTGIRRDGTLRGLSSRNCAGSYRRGADTDPGTDAGGSEKGNAGSGNRQGAEFPSDKNAEHFCQQRHGGWNGPI